MNVPLDTKFPAVYSGMTCHKGKAERGGEDDQRRRVIPCQRAFLGRFCGAIYGSPGVHRSVMRETRGIRVCAAWVDEEG